MLPIDIDAVQDGLLTKRLGLKIHYFSELDSTNSFARVLAQNGVPEGDVVVAETQTQGRGRLGRPWLSPPKTNLYISFILRPRLIPADAPKITLTAAVALADTVDSFSVVPPVIKWPNDILIQGKKVAGILTESSCASDTIESVILGIGVNLNWSPELMPEAIRNRATSLLAINGTVVSREAFLQRLIQDVDRCYGELEDAGFRAIAPRWQGWFGLKGKKVRVEMTDETLLGTATGIDADGRLIVVDGRGNSRRVVAGDVIPVDE